MRAVLLAALLLAKVGAFAQFEGWHRDLGSARAEAKQRQVPLLIVFVHEGCPVCAELESQLATSRARQALAPLAKVVLEFIENRGLAARYGVDATPTILVYCPTGECVYRYEGSLSPAGLSSLARRALAACNSQIERSSKTSTSNPAEVASPGPPPSTGTQRTTQTMPPTASLRNLRSSLYRLPKRGEAQRDSQGLATQYRNYRTMGTRTAHKGGI